MHITHMVSGRDTTLVINHKFQHDLAKESWAMYALGMLFIALRTYARIRRNGIKALAVDDYLMLLAAVWYTMLVVCLNAVAGGGGGNLYPPDMYATFSEQDIQNRIKGAKVSLIYEQSMLNLIYTLKACMICVYTRLTVQLKHQIFVKALAIYIACGYVGTQLAFFFTCRPFTGFWAMPPPSPQCATLQQYAMAQAVFNISSDTFMLAISLPLLISTTLPMKQKIVLVGIFGMGMFIIVAAILTKIFNLKDVYSTVYMLWYVRESSVAVWVTNLPLIWPLLRETFPMLKSFTPGQRAYSNSRSKGRHNGGAYDGAPSTLGGGAGATGTGTNTSMHGGIGVKTSTRVSVTDRGFAMDTLRKKRDRGSSISIDSDERQLANGIYMGDMSGISTETTVEVDDASLRHMEEGGESIADGRSSAWDRERDDRGYHVRIEGPDRDGSLFGASGGVGVGVGASSVSPGFGAGRAG